MPVKKGKDGVKQEMHKLKVNESLKWLKNEIKCILAESIISGKSYTQDFDDEDNEPDTGMEKGKMDMTPRDFRRIAAAKRLRAYKIKKTNDESRLGMIKKVLNKRRLDKQGGKNTPQNVFGSKSKGNKAYTDKGRLGTVKPPMSKQELDAVHIGDKGRASIDQKAAQNRTAFNTLTQGLAAKEGGMGSRERTKTKKVKHGETERKGLEGLINRLNRGR